MRLIVVLKKRLLSFQYEYLEKKTKVRNNYLYMQDSVTGVDFNIDYNTYVHIVC